MSVSAFVAAFAVLATTTAVFAEEPQQLTDDGQLKLSPTFVDGGEAVVYSVHDVPNCVSLVRLSLSDGEREHVYPMMTDHQFDAAYSADGLFHCFAMSQSSPQLVLVIKHLKDDKEFVFRPEGARSTARTPRFLPDSSRIVFTLSAPGGQQIATVDLQGGDLKRLTQSPGTNCWPTVSPDGSQIIFASSRDGNFDLYSMQADDSDVARLTDTPGREMRCAWSPDGEAVAFTRVDAGNHDVFLMRPDGSAVRRLTAHPERDDFPAWHPDGDRLLTVSTRNGDCDLYLHAMDD